MHEPFIQGRFSVPPGREEDEEDFPVNIKPYNPEEIELKWQKNWDEAHCFEAKSDKSKPKFYGLI